MVDREAGVAGRGRGRVGGELGEHGRAVGIEMGDEHRGVEKRHVERPGDRQIAVARATAIEEDRDVVDAGRNLDRPCGVAEVDVVEVAAAIHRDVDRLDARDAVNEVGVRRLGGGTQGLTDTQGQSRAEDEGPTSHGVSPVLDRSVRLRSEIAGGSAGSAKTSTLTITDADVLGCELFLRASLDAGRGATPRA